MSADIPYRRPPADPALVALLAALWATTLAIGADTFGVTGARARIGLAVLGAILAVALAGALWSSSMLLRRRRGQVVLSVWTMAGAGALWLGAPALPHPLWFPLAALIIPLVRHVPPATTWVFVLLLVGAATAVSPPLAVVTLVHGAILLVWLESPTRSSRRWGPPLAGMFVLGAVVAAAATLLAMGQRPVPNVAVGDQPLLAAAGGAVVSVVAGLLLSLVLDRLFGRLTRSQLLELSDLGNPLLQRIATRAPGTWQHSRMMANLAESAAHAVGADTLLVRVGAYYHDLGKADEPQFFIENTGPGAPSGHDDLTPVQSAARIIDHVREGVRRGREAGLPEDIIDFMHTHHGSSRVEYFWQQAVKEAREGGRAPREEDFIYPGAVPETRETGILAIVDAVEAAARTLDQGKRSSLRQMVRQILFTKLEQGQLDTSGLQAADLNRISESLTQTLLAGSHDRILYPWQEEAPPPDETGPALRLDAHDAHVPVDPLPSGPLPLTKDTRPDDDDAGPA